MQFPPRNGRRALITGITGQDGSYLAELLLSKGYEVWGLVRHSSSSGTARIDHLLQADDERDLRLRLRYGDLTDGASLWAVLEESRPDEIYNLAAQSHVQVSFEMPAYTVDVTGTGAVRLLDAVRKVAPAARYYQATTSEVFGRAALNPQRESTPFQPRNPYGAAKAMACYVTQNFREAYGLFAVNGILFNHESPRRGEGFVTRKISLAAARIAAGVQRRLSLGNLDARRDWGFAGDYVEAMWRMLQADAPDDYVIATGVAHSVRQFCELVFAEVGLPLTWRGNGLSEVGLAADGRELVTVDADFLRPCDVDLLLGDASKARRALDWQPTVTLAELARMMARHDLKMQSVDNA